MCAFHLSVFVGAEKCELDSTLTLDVDSAARPKLIHIRCVRNTTISYLAYASRIAEYHRTFFRVVLMKCRQTSIIAIRYIGLSKRRTHDIEHPP